MFKTNQILVLLGEEEENEFGNQTNRGRDLAVNFDCDCLDERWKGSGIEHLMKYTIRLYGYNDVNFFDNVNAEPREFECKCGRKYTQQWFRDGHVEIQAL